MTTSKTKRLCLLACARKGMTFGETTHQLLQRHLGSVTELEWNLWVNYYCDIVRNDPYFEHELINNNRSLAWFANELNRRKQKQMIS